VSTTAAGAAEEPTGPDASGLPRVKGRDHWIVLDAAWAQRLGVRRSAGVYRIRFRELMLKLSQPAQHWASGVPSVTSAGLQRRGAGQKSAYDGEVWRVPVPESEGGRSTHAAA
jgi:hypothetical protein